MKKVSIINLRSTEVLLRLSVVPLTVSSAALVVQANASSDQYGEIKFTDLSGFKFLLATNCISAAYALISAALTFGGLKEMKYLWSFFILDQIVAYLMVTSSAAAAELLYLAHKGDIEVAWGEVCSYFGRFCSRGKTSVVLQYLALFCFICLSLISAVRIFSLFDPPSVSPNKEEKIQGMEMH
ncbi:CASP-like protein [Apostasia shenzhenica]|uniref:CASP-like protein n=1 Tax=Apostasia shenzhenica TaxID=1088818 RepID=A0A2I0AAL7_9ASPA|nr:CASP-like protein [Apostasia shenzhenica]